jgi:serine protease inhibitor ecotin
MEGLERMSIVSIMAAILEEELREHGIRGLTQRDRETIVHSMIERTAELETDINQHYLGSRLDDQT